MEHVPAYDARREEELRLLGYEVLRLHWADVVGDPQGTLVRVYQCLARVA